MKRFALCLLCLLLVGTLIVANGRSSANGLSLFGTAAASPVERLVPKVLAVRPHDKLAFTEGLLLHAGALYESTGYYGQSTLRKVDLQTGKVLQQVPLQSIYFGEGLALAGNRLVQLTWREQAAFVYDVDTFALLGTFAYFNEGWGLCFDGSQFFQTDGSHNITARDPKTFQVIRQLAIQYDGSFVESLNELECAGDSLYANVWHTDHILRIDKQTGRVIAEIDASGLLAPKETCEAGTEGVLNGIAYDAQRDTFWITGKLWPWIFEVRFVPRPPTQPVQPAISPTPCDRSGG